MPMRSTIAGNDGDDVPPFILNGILRQAKFRSESSGMAPRDLRQGEQRGQQAAH